MKYGYARVSTDGQSVDAQVRQLTRAGCKKVFREVASGAKTDRAQLRRLLDQLEADESAQPSPLTNSRVFETVVMKVQAIAIYPGEHGRILRRREALEGKCPRRSRS